MSAKPTTAKKAPRDRRFREVSLDRIDNGGYNVRESVWWPSEDSAALVADVRARGVLQPVVLAERKAGGPLLVVCGHRRCAAAMGAGLDTVPAIVHRGLSDAEIVEMQLAENLQRRELNAIEIAKGLGRLRDFTGDSEVAIGMRFGHSGPWAHQYLSLLRLNADVQRRVATGTITASVAFKLAKHARDHPEAVAKLAAELEGVTDRGADAKLVAAGLRVAPIESYVGDDDGRDAGGATLKRFSAGGQGTGAASQCDCSCDCCQVPGHTRVELGLPIAAIATLRGSAGDGARQFPEAPPVAARAKGAE